jgi:DDE family transposase
LKAASRIFFAHARRRGGYHLLVDAGGLPLAVGLSAANTHDSLLLEQVVDAVPAIIGPRGRPGRALARPAKLHADKGHDYLWAAGGAARRGITPRIAGVAWNPPPGWGRQR